MFTEKPMRDQGDDTIVDYLVLLKPHVWDGSVYQRAEH